MFGPLGGQELILILVIALIVFGPRRLPEIGKSVGRMLGEFRRASNDFKRTIEDEVEAERQREAAPTIAPPPAAPVAEGVSSDVPPAASAPPPDPGDVPPSLDRPAGSDLPPGTEGAATDLPPLAPPTAPTFARDTGTSRPPWGREPEEPR